jgi:hypothetical protein
MVPISDNGLSMGLGLSDYASAPKSVRRRRFWSAEEKRRMSPRAQGDFVFDDIGEIERKLLAGELTSDVARTLIWSKQWCAAKLAQKRYGDKIETTGTVVLDVADRIIARWKENLAELNRTDPIDVTPRAPYQQIDQQRNAGAQPFPPR